MTGERAWRDYQLYMKESAKALNAVERKSEIVTKLEGLFSLAIMAYKDAQRQTKEGTKIPGPLCAGYLVAEGNGDTGEVGRAIWFPFAQGFLSDAEREYGAEPGNAHFPSDGQPAQA
jgi:hypothetical protein